MSSSYRISLDNWLRELDVKANRLLDIGGSQLPLRGRVKSFEVNEYTIADLNEPHVDSPKPDVVLDLNYQTNAEGDQYDNIFCLEVFDYVWNPDAAMHTIASFLKPSGIAWVTFPTVYPTHNPIEDDALRYMEGGIRKLAKASGLKIEEMIRRRPETNAIENLWGAERMRAAKGYDHHFTGWIVRFSK